jgi:hypothetical protein
MTSVKNCSTSHYTKSIHNSLIPGFHSSIGRISLTPLSNFQTIYKARRPNQCCSLSTNTILYTKNLKLFNSPLKTTRNSAGYKKKLEFNRKKRQRKPSAEKSCKKTKLSGKNEWNLMVSFLDEDNMCSVNFRCYSEEVLIPKAVSSVPVVPSQNDDDCKTLEKEIEISSHYLAFQLEQSIIKEPCKE